VVKVKLSQWLNNAELSQEKLTIHQKVYFFDPSYLKIPEFIYDNPYSSQKETEVQMLVDHLTQ